MPSSACDWSSDVCSSDRSEEHTSELQSRSDLVCRLLLAKKNTTELQSRSELVCRLLIEKIYGRVKFSADGGLVQKPPIVVQNQSGKFVMGYPAEFGGAKA